MTVHITRENDDGSIFVTGNGGTMGDFGSWEEYSDANRPPAEVAGKITHEEVQQPNIIVRALGKLGLN